ncbi:MAG TPA: CDGSH iron-sulfur domain-containing protein [Methylomirabilota bacterium]|nr:CDGSH iron-sulfur domain-containing protein [Methylomirabilota bacterium]
MDGDKVIIQTRLNGPYLIKGAKGIRLIDADGNEFTVDRDTIALCRCGGSTTKPFCDGTHSKLGFQAAEKAVREADQGR